MPANASSTAWALRLTCSFRCRGTAQAAPRSPVGQTVEVVPMLLQASLGLGLAKLPSDLEC
eukprot:11177836-Lingulodinium_polyedra.AAC.1